MRGRIGKEMRRLCGDLVAELNLSAPADSGALCAALCDAMSRRRGRPVTYRAASFPPGTASGLWLDMTDQDLIVIEERTAPDHQLVILGHELWHMNAGHCSHHVDGAGVAARLLADGVDLQTTVLKVAARTPVGPQTPVDWADEHEAETFGLLLASKCRAWLGGEGNPGPATRDQLVGRLEASLGYRSGPRG